MSYQDTIFIEQLKIDAIIGVNPWERQVKQPVILDLELTTDTTAAANSDNLEHAVNYQLIHDGLIEFVSNSNFQLIERLASKIVDYLLNDAKIKKAKLKLSKPAALEKASNVGIIIEREAK